MSASRPRPSCNVRVLLEMNPGLSFRMADVFPDVADGSIEASKQGGIQALSLAITLGIALLGGLIVGESQVLQRPGGQLKGF